MSTRARKGCAIGGEQAMRPKKRRRRSIQDAGSIRDGQHNVATGNQINNHGPLEDPKAKNEINNNSDNNDKAHTLRDLRELVARSEGDDMIDGKLPPLNLKTLGQCEISLSHVNIVVEKQRPNSVGRQLGNRCTRLRVAAQEGIDPRSALGAVFRTNHKKGTPEGDRYAELDRQDASEFRRKWAAKQFLDIQEKKGELPGVGASRPHTWPLLVIGEDDPGRWRMERCGCHKGSIECREKMHSHGSAVGWDTPSNRSTGVLNTLFRVLGRFHS